MRVELENPGGWATLLSLSLLNTTTDCTAQSQVYEILLDQIAGLFQVIIIILGPTLLLHLMCVCLFVFVLVLDNKVRTSGCV